MASESGASESGEGESRESETAAVLDRFVAERLITVDADTVQITHDALLTAWPRLSGWIDTGREGLQTRRRIAEGARAWEQANRESAALLRGSQLGAARDWAADEDNRASLGRLASEFLAESVAAAHAQQRAERRRTHRLQRLVAALAVLVLAVGGLAAYSFGQRHDAIVTRDGADSREIALEAGQVRSQTSRWPRTSAWPPTNLAHAAGDGEPARVVRFPVRGPADRLLRRGRGGRRQPGPDAARGGRRGRDTAAVERLLPRPPGGSWRTAGAGRRQPAVRDRVQPGREDPGRGRRWQDRSAVGRAAPGTRSGSAWSRPGQHGVLAGVQPGWEDSRRRGRRRRGASVESGRCVAARSVRHFAGWVDPCSRSPSLRTGNSRPPGSTDGTVRLWDVARPAAAVQLRGPASQVTGVAFSPRGDLLAAASQDHKVWLWRVSGTGKASPDGTLNGAVNWVNAVSFSPDGSLLAAGTADASVLVWNVATRALTATLPHPQPVTSLAWDGTGRLASGDADGTVSLWALPAPVLVTGNAPTAVAYSPDGSVIADGGQDVQLWSAARRELIATGPLPAGVIVNALAYSPGGTLLAIGRSDGTAELLAARTLAPVGAPFRVTAAGNAESVAFSPDGKVLATSGDDGTVRLWSVSDPARPRLLASLHDSGTYVYTVVFAPDGKTLAAASTDNLTRLWDVADPARPVALGRPLSGPASYAIGLAFSPDSRLLAVGSADKTVRIWDLRDPGHAVLSGAPLTGPTGYVWALAFSPDGSTLAAGVTDGTVWLWHVTDPAHPSLAATLTGPAGHVYSVAYSPSGATLAAASTDGTVHLWDTSPAAAQAAVCGNAGQTLTAQEWATYIPGVTYQDPC